ASLFTLGSLACGFAPTMVTLIVARAIQGLGAGGIMPIGQTIIGDVYSPAERARIQGYLSSMWGVSAVFGPLLGAFFVEQTSWPWVFWFNIPLAIAVMVLLSVVLPENLKRAAHTVDVAGAVLLSIAVGGLMLLLLQGRDLGAAAWGVGALSAIGFAAFLFQESRAPEPLLPMILWRDRVLRTCISGSLFVGATSMGVSAFLPTYVQGVMGKSAFVAGSVLSSLAIAWPIGATSAGQLMLRTSYRTTSIIGAAILTLGGVLMTQVQHSDTIVFPAAAAFVVGLGLGITNSSFTVAVQDAAGWSVRGIATATNTFMRMLGASVGTALLAAVVNASLASRLPGATDAAEILVDPARRATLSAADLARFSEAVGGGIATAFIVTIATALGALAFAWRMPADAKPGQLTQQRSSV
ncbi:MAG: MFS transporter, partial [Alphaproteobacteria bacterium]|nr:MFS transporter [Alphaproteobacteria bacterium]